MSVGKIQRSPKGLLQFLSMVGSGVSPTAMGEDVRATVEMRPFYGAEQLSMASAIASVQVPGDSVTLTVPNNERWLMLGVSLRFLAQAIGDVIQFGALIFPGTAPGAIQMLNSELITTVTATATPGLGIFMPEPFILQPGATIVGRMFDGTLAAGRNLTIASLHYRIPS